MSSSTQPRASIGGDIVGGILKDPGVQQSIISGIIGLLSGLLAKLFSHGTPAPTQPVTKPTPVPVQPDPTFPDDIHPAPKQSRTVGSVRLALARAQLSRERFPDAYTEDNPFGLVTQDELHKIREGTSALPFGSKFWLDLTPFDEAGKEITRPEMIAMGLAFRTEHHCGGAFIAGAGSLPGDPSTAAPYRTTDTDAISNGITAWTSSLGYLHQMKAWGEGSFDVYGSVGDVETDHFTLKVS